MSEIKCTDTITINYDEETMTLLRTILNCAVKRVRDSGIPIDLNGNESITKLKTLSGVNGIMTIKLPYPIQYTDGTLEKYGILSVKESDNEKNS